MRLRFEDATGFGPVDSVPVLAEPGQGDRARLALLRHEGAQPFRPDP